jgi:hypothetical protein
MDRKRVTYCVWLRAASAGGGVPYRSRREAGYQARDRNDLGRGLDRGLKSALIGDGRARVEVARERRLDGSPHLYPSRLIGVLSWRGLAIGVHMRRRCSTASMSSAALASCTHTSRRRPPTTAGARQLHPLAVPPQA